MSEKLYCNLKLIYVKVIEEDLVNFLVWSQLNSFTRFLQMVKIKICN